MYFRYFQPICIIVARQLVENTFFINSVLWILYNIIITEVFWVPGRHKREFTAVKTLHPFLKWWLLRKTSLLGNRLITMENKNKINSLILFVQLCKIWDEIPCSFYLYSDYSTYEILFPIVKSTIYCTRTYKCMLWWHEGYGKAKVNKWLRNI